MNCNDRRGEAFPRHRNMPRSSGTTGCRSIYKAGEEMQISNMSSIYPKQNIVIPIRRAKISLVQTELQHCTQVLTALRWDWISWKPFLILNRSKTILFKLDILRKMLSTGRHTYLPYNQQLSCILHCGEHARFMAWQNFLINTHLSTDGVSMRLFFLGACAKRIHRFFCAPTLKRLWRLHHNRAAMEGREALRIPGMPKWQSLSNKGFRGLRHPLWRPSLEDSQPVSRARLLHSSKRCL